MLKAISAREAEQIAKRTNYPLSTKYDGGRKTFYATNDQRNEVYEYDTKAERDADCKA